MLFSFNKFLLLIAILATVWYGFKLIGRLDQARKQKLREQHGGATKRPAASRRREPDTVDLVRGEDGKSFVAPGWDRDQDRGEH